MIKGYLEGDKSSHEFATLLEWNNIYYEPKSALFKGNKPIVRLGLVQWQMRQFVNIESLFEQMEFFCGCGQRLPEQFCTLSRIV